MYRKLLPHINQFVCLRQGPFSRSYVGRLISVDPETVEIQTYYEDGGEADLWTINISTITEMSAKSRVLSTLALKVKWASSEEDDDEIIPTQPPEKSDRPGQEESV